MIIFLFHPQKNSPMKKILTTLLFVFSLFFIAKATHNYGGEITVNQAPSIEVPIDEVTLSVGDTLKFEVEGVDPEMGEILVQAIAQPFRFDNPPTFNVPPDFTTGPINASFEWEIFDNHVYLNPYYLVFRIEEKDAVNCGLTSYHVLKININDSPTNNTFTNQKLDVEVFPNPVSDGNIFVKFNYKKERENIQIQVISLNGKVLLENQFKNTNQPTKHNTLIYKELRVEIIF